MKQLPNWYLTNPLPSVYDTESKTAVEMVSKLYTAMKTLIDEYNTYIENLDKSNIEYKETINKSVNEFKTCVQHMINNFIKCAKERFNCQDKTINDAVNKMLNTAREVVRAAIVNGEVLQDEIARNSVDELSKAVSVLTSRMNSFTNLSDGSTTGDAELIDIRTAFDGTVYNTAGEAVRAQCGDNAEKIDDITSYFYKSLNVEYGTFSGEDLTDAPINSKRLRSVAFTISEPSSLNVNSDFLINVYGKNSDNVVTRIGGFVSGIVLSDTSMIYRALVKKADETDITESELNAVNVRLINETSLINNMNDFKIVSFMGDSITAGVGSDNLYHMELHNKYGWICNNYGCAGTGFVKTNANTTGLFGHGETGKASTEELTGNNNFVDRMSQIHSKSSLIVVFGGVNDYTANVTMDEFINGVESVINYYQTNRPNTPLVFLTPLMKNRTDSTTTLPDGNTPNGVNLKLVDYVNKIKEICANKSVKCIDMYTESGLNPYNTEHQTYFFSDGLHPNNNGHLKIAKIIGDVCANLIN